MDKTTQEILDRYHNLKRNEKLVCEGINGYKKRFEQLRIEDASDTYPAGQALTAYLSVLTVIREAIQNLWDENYQILSELSAEILDDF